jgi:flagella basal body P-ring formation protein FlgA
MTHIFTVVTLALALIASAPPAQPIARVTFRSHAEVNAPVIRLGDIAVIEAADASLVRRLEAVEVGTAPLVGRQRSVSAAYARVRVSGLGYRVSGGEIRHPKPDTQDSRLPLVQFAGSEFVTVVRSQQVLAGARIEQAACDAAQLAEPGTIAEVASPVADQRLPLGAVSLQPERLRPTGNSSTTVPVQLLVDGQTLARVVVSVRLTRRAPALVATRDLPPGTVVGPGDVRVEERPVIPGPSILSDAAAAIGQQVAAPVKAGATLTAGALKPALLIKRGARVRLVCAGPGFIISAVGEALQDGSKGQLVRVRNLSSLQELTGLVRDDATVEVGF